MDIFHREIRVDSRFYKRVCTLLLLVKLLGIKDFVLKNAWIRILVMQIAFLPASTRSVPPGIHFALLLLLVLVLVLLLWRPLVKLGTISADS
jgi:hypothetical protein